jgi:dihydrolipoamide dehydrogenase
LPTELTVIGAGPGGYQAAIRAAQLGARVSLVEAAAVGGTCLHWGCIPTKSLLASARALAVARRLEEFGVAGGGRPRADLPAMLRRKDQVVATQAQGLERLFAAHGVELVAGRARLAGPREVEVELARGGRRTLRPERLILATGSVPARLPGLEPDGRLVLGSDHVFGLEEPPAGLVVVGGGAVGCELAWLLQTLGSQVTLVEGLDRLLPLPNLEPECSKLLQRELKKAGVKVLTGMVVAGWEPAGRGVRARLEASPFMEHRRPPNPREVEAGAILVAAGRQPRTRGLGLEAAGVELEARGGVKVDAGLAATAPGVYAVGDVLGPSRPMLAHLAGREGLAAAANALGASERVPYSAVPAVAYTEPQVAWVGLSQAQAEAQGLEAAAAGFDLRGLGKAQALGELAGFCRLVCAADTGRLLGASAVGAVAGELIHEAALALTLGATAHDLARTIHAHPTLSEAWPEAAEALSGRAVHLPPGRGAPR